MKRFLTQFVDTGPSPDATGFFRALLRVSPTPSCSIAGQAIKAIHNSRRGCHNLVYRDDHIIDDHSSRFETLVMYMYVRASRWQW